MLGYDEENCSCDDEENCSCDDCITYFNTDVIRPIIEVTDNIHIHVDKILEKDIVQKHMKDYAMICCPNHVIDNKLMICKIMTSILNDDLEDVPTVKFKYLDCSVKYTMFIIDNKLQFNARGYCMTGPSIF